MKNFNIPQNLLLTLTFLLPYEQQTRAVEVKSLFVAVGDTVRVTCLFNRSLWHEWAQIGWLEDSKSSHRDFHLYKNFNKEGKNQSTDKDIFNNVNMTGSGAEGDFSLLFSPVHFEHSGRFTCYYRNTSTHILTKLKVVKLITAEVTSPKYPVEEGSETTLRCSISSGADVDVEWMRGELSVGKGKEMKVSQMGVTDGGKWTCIVSTMNKTRLTINHFINVYKRSHDGVKRSIFITPVNSNITLPGVNHHSTRWYKVNESKSLMKDRDEQTNGKFTITEDFSLRISDVRPEDTGHYECRSDRDIYYILIIIVTATVTPNKGASEGTTRTLTCDLSHPVPDVTFGWRHETYDHDVTNHSSFTLTFAPEDPRKWMCVLYGESGRIITTISQTIVEGQGTENCRIFIWMFIAYVLLLVIASELLVWYLLKKKGTNQRKSRNKYMK
uniref:T-cell surface glycoprotein CD4-like isoform X1 n=2 Tax=Myxine glutinosa TaxID=7769 RepID=UPI0035902AFB